MGVLCFSFGVIHILATVCGGKNGTSYSYIVPFSLPHTVCWQDFEDFWPLLVDKFTTETYVALLIFGNAVCVWLYAPLIPPTSMPIYDHKCNGKFFAQVWVLALNSLELQYMQFIRQTFKNSWNFLNIKFLNLSETIIFITIQIY